MDKSIILSDGLFKAEEVGAGGQKEVSSKSEIDF